MAVVWLELSYWLTRNDVIKSGEFWLVTTTITLFNNKLILSVTVLRESDLMISNSLKLAETALDISKQGQGLEFPLK
jgi:hypothetical protein